MTARKSQPSDFRKILEGISHRHDTRKVFDAFTRFAACVLAAQTRKAEYLEEAKRWEKPAIDIGRTAWDMAFVNTTLWGVPTRIIHGNSLSMECWAAWSNIHYIAPWLPLALRNQTPEAMEQGQPPKPAEVECIKVSLGQG